MLFLFFLVFWGLEGYAQAPSNFTISGNVVRSDTLQVATLSIANGTNSFTGGKIVVNNDFSMQGNRTLNCISGTIVFRGDFDVGGSSTFSMGNCTIVFEGDIARFGNANNFDPGTSTVIFAGNTNISWNSGNTIQFYNTIVEDGATVSSAVNVFVLNDMTVEGNGSYQNTNNTTLNVVGTVTGYPQILGPAPYMLDIEVINASTIRAVFNKPMNQGPLQTIGNYKVRDVVTGAFTDAGSSDITGIISAVQDSGDPAAVTLQLQGTIQPDKNYYLWVRNLTSQNDNITVSTPHRKLFIDASPPIFYSRATGNWEVTSTWAIGSHTGPQATRIPGQSSDQVIIGNNHTVSITSSVALAPLESIVVNSTGTLQVNSAGTLILNNKIVSGNGSFNVQSSGSLQIGSSAGISSSGATGNIQTQTRSFSSGANYTYNGAAAQVTGSGLPNEVNNLVINNAQGVTLSANTKINGTLTLTSGDFIIESNRSLVATNPAYNGGQFRALRSISVPQDGQTPGGWRLLSSPINSNYSNFLSGITTQGFTGSTLGNSFYDATLDVSYDGLMPNVLHYDETFNGTDNQRWRTISNASNSIVPGRGYFTYVFGNITSDERYNQSNPVLSISGQENPSTVTLPVTYTETGDKGWNLVGNPFLAAIDWDNAAGWTRTNIDNTIYVWDETTAQFRFWNGITGTLNDPFNEDDASGSGIIMPFQGFWVKANDSNPALSVNQQAKTLG